MFGSYLLHFWANFNVLGLVRNAMGIPMMFPTKLVFVADV